MFPLFPIKSQLPLNFQLPKYHSFQQKYYNILPRTFCNYTKVTEIQQCWKGYHTDDRCGEEKKLSYKTKLKPHNPIFV